MVVIGEHQDERVIAARFGPFARLANRVVEHDGLIDRALHIERKVPSVVGVRDRVAKRRHINAYLASSRRLAFNEMGIFRRYPELDAVG